MKKIISILFAFLVLPVMASAQATVSFRIRMVDAISGAPVSGVHVCAGTDIFGGDKNKNIVFSGNEDTYGFAISDGSGEASFANVPSTTRSGRDNRIVVGAVKPGVGFGADTISARYLLRGSYRQPIDITLNTGIAIAPRSIIPPSCRGASSTTTPPPPSSNIPAPTDFRIEAASDSIVQLRWNYTGQATSFRLFAMEPCFGGPSLCPRADLSWIRDAQIWVPQSPDGNQPTFSSNLRGWDIFVPQNAVIPTFAGAILNFALIAETAQGPSDPILATIQMSDRYGCTKSQNKQSGQVTIILRDDARYTPNPVNPGERKLSPFPFNTNPVSTHTGTAWASFNGDLSPTADYYGPAQGLFPGPAPVTATLPFTLDPVTFSQPGNTHMALKGSRGYSCLNRVPNGQCVGERHANATVDARFQIGGNPYYTALHLFINQQGRPDYDRSLQNDAAYLIDFIAGDAVPDQPDKFGMVSLKPALSITGGSPPNFQTPGFLSGSARGRVFLIVPQDPADLPGSLRDDGSGNPVLSGLNSTFDWWESDVEIQFNNLPLNDDHCF